MSFDALAMSSCNKFDLSVGKPTVKLFDDKKGLGSFGKYGKHRCEQFFNLLVNGVDSTKMKNKHESVELTILS